MKMSEKECNGTSVPMEGEKDIKVPKQKLNLINPFVNELAPETRTESIQVLNCFLINKCNAVGSAK